MLKYSQRYPVQGAALKCKIIIKRQKCAFKLKLKNIFLYNYAFFLNQCFLIHLIMFRLPTVLYWASKEDSQYFYQMCN